MIQIQGNRIHAHFENFNRENYATFLRIKQLPETDVIYHHEYETYTITAPSRYAEILGVERPSEPNPLPMGEFLFDDQVAIVQMALDAKRFACWSECGMGKTLCEAEFARQVHHKTGGKVLIVTQNEIVSQWLEMIADFYPDMTILRLKNQDHMREWAVSEDGPSFAIANYEKFNPKEDDQNIRELRNLAGIVLDESSRLKTGGGKQKWCIIKSCKGIEYKLSATATPAPNDYMEYASQASFLERMRSENEIIWTYFSKNKQGEWTVKRHAQEEFFRWMSLWSIYMRDPRVYGWRQGWEPPPLPEYHIHEIETTPEQQEAAQRFATDQNGQMKMFQDKSHGITGRIILSEIAKGFRYTKNKKFERITSRKPESVANLIQEQRNAGHVILVWVEYDAEATLISEKLKELDLEHELISGSIPRAKREPILSRFRKGDVPILIGKAKMLGFGQNFQTCTSMIFSGWNDSFENFYQAVRRAYRYGQTEPLQVHIPVVRELEGDMLENVLAKQERHEAAIRDMEQTYLTAREKLEAI